MRCVFVAVILVLGSFYGCAERATFRLDGATSDSPVVTDTPVAPDAVDDVPASCPSPNATCGAACVDLTTSSTNCGACGRTCSMGQTCFSSRCIPVAGAPCTMPSPTGGQDPACGNQFCVTGLREGWCSTICDNSTSASIEEEACGGPGSTCLDTVGNGRGACSAACNVSATNETDGACRPGWVCTGFWFARGGTPDRTGCSPFCTNNSNCPSGYLCNQRIGICNTIGVVATNLPDGSPCNPMNTTVVPGETVPRNAQCRGKCFSASTTNPTQGVCGSFLTNRRSGGMCPDDPANVFLRSPQVGTDNLEVCVFRRCSRDAECSAPHICRFDESDAGVPRTAGPRFCNYPSASQPTGVP